MILSGEGPVHPVEKSVISDGGTIGAPFAAAGLLDLAARDFSNRLGHSRMDKVGSAGRI